MTDDTTKRGTQDRIRINVNEPHEVRHWTQALGVDEAKLRAAVKQVGVMAADVRAHLSTADKTST